MQRQVEACVGACFLQGALATHCSAKQLTVGSDVDQESFFCF